MEKLNLVEKMGNLITQNLRLEEVLEKLKVEPTLRAVICENSERQRELVREMFLIEEKQREMSANQSSLSSQHARLYEKKCELQKIEQNCQNIIDLLEKSQEILREPRVEEVVKAPQPLRPKFKDFNIFMGKPRPDLSDPFGHREILEGIFEEKSTLERLPFIFAIRHSLQGDLLNFEDCWDEFVCQLKTRLEITDEETLEFKERIIDVFNTYNPPEPTEKLDTLEYTSVNGFAVTLFLQKLPKNRSLLGIWSVTINFIGDNQLMGEGVTWIFRSTHSPKEDFVTFENCWDEFLYRLQGTGKFGFTPKDQKQLKQKIIDLFDTYNLHDTHNKNDH